MLDVRALETPMNWYVHINCKSQSCYYCVRVSLSQAQHAQRSGAGAIAVMPTTYFKPPSIGLCMYTFRGLQCMKPVSCIVQFEHELSYGPASVLFFFIVQFHGSSSRFAAIFGQRGCACCMRM